ncbi:hypothetical protein [Pseudoclavibacter sp. CFCC 11306]|uniref:hypothetical protein n=1 Tax=Pseudoclavibacter sp. CFCC 11306 TaxID=1564493 RepID=UPI0013010113|nr:hypothetical protein [Pseudoclavibacter sp. CFCC 11306]KAB1658839.1 hypothetical protein F8O09_04500 [Pseudoclavibacter sp. CFCC 11306]
MAFALCVGTEINDVARGALVPSHQADAGRTLGMKPRQQLRYVRVPQWIGLIGLIGLMMLMMLMMLMVLMKLMELMGAGHVAWPRCLAASLPLRGGCAGFADGRRKCVVHADDGHERAVLAQSCVESAKPVGIVG